MLEQLASSNAVQLTATAATGALGYLLVARWPLVISLVGYTVAGLLTVSFLLDLGEAYNYSGIYKRAFFYFGDDVTTWLTPIFMWAILAKRRLLAIALACGILFSGTKISLILLVLQYLAIVVISKEERLAITVDFLKPLAVAAVVYVPLALVSPYAIAAGNQVAPVVFCSQVADAECDPLLQPSLRGNGDCRQGDCLNTTVARPLRHRAYSAVAGLWMTLQGGFPGARYPNSPEKFADLMIEANPWGINDTFEITRDEWRRIGTVQTPYLQFGAGYGMVLLAALLVGTAVICVLGLRSIITKERGPFLAFTVFFVVNAIFNQTQPWIGRGPILFAMGLSAAHILARFISQRSAARDGTRTPPTAVRALQAQDVMVRSVGQPVPDVGAPK